MRVSPPIQADDCKIETIISAKNLPIALRRRSDRQTCRSHCKRVEKLASCNHLFSFPTSRPIVLSGRGLFGTGDNGIPLVKTLASKDKSAHNSKKFLNLSGTASFQPS